jgi:hypothetical protein
MNRTLSVCIVVSGLLAGAAPNAAADQDNSYAAARWSVGLEVAVVPERVKFFHRNEGYRSLEDADSYLIRSEQGLRFALVGKFFANLEYDYMYNNEPAPGTKSSDTAFIFGLGYECNF